MRISLGSRITDESVNNYTISQPMKDFEIRGYGGFDCDNLTVSLPIHIGCMIYKP